MDLKSGAAGSQEKRGICKKAYAEAVRRNQHQRPASVLEIPFFPSPVKKKKKNKKLWFSRETAEKRGRRVIRRTSSIGIGRGRVSTFSFSLRFARGNVTSVSCYFSNRR